MIAMEDGYRAGNCEEKYAQRFVIHFPCEQSNVALKKCKNNFLKIADRNSAYSKQYKNKHRSGSLVCSLISILADWSQRLELQYLIVKEDSHLKQKHCVTAILHFPKPQSEQYIFDSLHTRLVSENSPDRPTWISENKRDENDPDLDIVRLENTYLEKKRRCVIFMTNDYQDKFNKAKKSKLKKYLNLFFQGRGESVKGEPL